jgi:predicted transposase YdaD
MTAAADLVFRSGDVLYHLDFQSSPDPELPQRLFQYNALLHVATGLPVHTMAVLLRPRADRSDLTGEWGYAGVPDRGETSFRFEIVRLWQVPIETFLNGPAGLLAFAPFARLPGDAPREDVLPGLLTHVAQRAIQELPEPTAKRVLTAICVLLGMYLPSELRAQLMRDAMPVDLMDSNFVREIFEEGEAKGRLEDARGTVFRQGRLKFGEPDPGTVAAINVIHDLEQLHRMADAILNAKSWDDVLATP